MILKPGAVGIPVERVQAALGLAVTGSYDGTLDTAVDAYAAAIGYTGYPGYVDEFIWNKLFVDGRGYAPLTVLNIPGAASLYDLAVVAGSGIPKSLATAADLGLYSTAPNVWAAYALTAYGRSLGGAANAAAAKTLLSLTKTDVGLGNVDNTSDATKNVLYAATAGSAPPTAHAASHAAAGSDPLTLAQSQVTSLTTDLAARVLKAGDTMTGLLSIGTAGTATNLQLNRAATAPGVGDASILRINASLTALVAGDLYGMKYDPTFVKAASGTHAYFLGTNLQPPVISTPGGSTATVTNAVTLFVGNEPTGATNNYALWVNAGKSKFGGNVNADSKLAVQNPSPTALLQVSGSLTAPSVSDASIVRVNSTITAQPLGDLYAFKYDPTFVTAATGTHGYFMGMNLQPPTITALGAAITNAVTLFVGGAPATGTNKYAFWVYAGTSKFGGPVLLPAGSATASTAPLKFTSGTLNTAAEAGAVEFDGTSFFGSTSFRSAFVRGVHVSASLTPTVVAANSASVQTYTVTGLVVPHAVTVSPPSIDSGLGIMWARCSASDTLEICWRNFTGGDLTPTSGTYRVAGARV